MGCPDSCGFVFFGEGEFVGADFRFGGFVVRVVRDEAAADDEGGCAGFADFVDDGSVGVRAVVAAGSFAEGDVSVRREGVDGLAVAVEVHGGVGHGDERVRGLRCVGGGYGGVVGVAATGGVEDGGEREAEGGGERFEHVG